MPCRFSHYLVRSISHQLAWMLDLLSVRIVVDVTAGRGTSLTVAAVEVVRSVGHSWELHLD